MWRCGLIKVQSSTNLWPLDDPDLDCRCEPSHKPAIFSKKISKSDRTRIAINDGWREFKLSGNFHQLSRKIKKILLFIQDRHFSGKNCCYQCVSCYPNPPCQLSLWEETGAPGENPRLSTERWLTLFTWVGYERLEPATSEVKGACTANCATEAPSRQLRAGLLWKTARFHLSLVVHAHLLGGKIIEDLVHDLDFSVMVSSSKSAQLKAEKWTYKIW